MNVKSLLLAGVSASVVAGAAFAAPVAKEDMVLVVSVINTTNPYMISNIEGGKALSEELGIPLEIVNSNGSSQTEIAGIMSILASGKTPIMFVNTVASSDAPTIVDAVKQAGGYVTIWWNKPADYKPQDVGDNFVAFQKIPGLTSPFWTSVPRTGIRNWVPATRKT